MPGSCQTLPSISCHLNQDLPGHSIGCQQRSWFCSVGLPSAVSVPDAKAYRFETREVAEQVIRDFHSVLTEHDGVKLFLRFADTKAQKQLKLQSQERRSWRSREYSYSVEHTPSPTMTRFQNVIDGASPGSYQSPAGAGRNYTPDTSVSPQ